MAIKTIVFTIGDGEVVLESSGFKGKACEVASKAFEETLGGPITNKKKKAEYHSSEVVRLNAGGGTK